MADRTFTPDEMAELFLSFGDGVLRSMMAGGMAAVNKMAADTVANELSFPKSGPPVWPGLRWQTGHLRRSVAASPEVHEISDKEAEASFGTSVPYGVQFERGFEGYEQVAAHTRRVASRNVYGGGKTGRGKTAQGVAFVRAHKRYVTRDARHYLGRTLEADSPVVDRFVGRSLWMLWLTGRVPTAGEVGRAEV